MERKKQQLLAVIIIIAIIIIGLIYVFVQNDGEKLELTSIKSLALTLDDLPEGYEIGTEIYSDVEENNMTERYWIEFQYLEWNDTRNIGSNYSEIWLYLIKYNSTIHCIQYLDDYKNVYLEASNYSVNTVEIGDESFNFTARYLDFNNTGIIVFRISNVVCRLECWDKDYDFIFDLAKIVERRIYDSID